MLIKNKKVKRMQLLDTVLSLLLNEENKEKIAPIIDAVLKNGFNLQSILKNIDVSTLMPLLQGLFKQNQPSKQNYDANPLSPISNIADREIIFALNKYISAV